VNFAPGRLPLGGKSPKKYTVPQKRPTFELL